MAEKTGISWCHHTMNPVWGCTKLSPGCQNCYAEALAKRWGHDVWGPDKPRRTFGPKHWAEPLKWDRKAAKAGERRRVFVGSMCDIFEDHPDVATEREKLWPLIRQTPHLDYLLLTKRPERIRNDLPRDWGTGYPNVWLGVSVESADYLWRVRELRGGVGCHEFPAAVKFISYEPAIGPLDGVSLLGIDWVIFGGESGPHHRPADVSWARDARDRCRVSGTAYFHKQSSGPRPGTGIELDGEIIQEFPTPRVTAG